MVNRKNDGYYIDKIKADILFIVKNMRNVNMEELSENEILLDSMLFRMIQISENSKSLSSAFKANNSNIPWDAITGLRNRIIHDYGNVDLGIVFETLKKDIPNLLEYF